MDEGRTMLADQMFQLTTSRRGRPFLSYISLTFYICFNSRPHEEVDILDLLHVETDQLFQLTTSRRGRLHRQLLLF